jgi:hypothetical protein
VTVCPAACGPTTAEQHPRRPDVTRCANCKEHIVDETETAETETAERSWTVPNRADRRRWRRAIRTASRRRARLRDQAAKTR